MSHTIGRGRYARETYPEPNNQAPQAGAGAVATVQVGGSSPATSVQLDSAAFTLPAGMTRVKVDTFISVQPSTGGEQIQYNLLVDGFPVSSASGGVQAFGQTGTVVAQLSVNASLTTILTPSPGPHVYSIFAQSAHNLQIGDGCAAVVLTPLP